MKKLLLLSLLLLISNQGLAALCPDGSIPTRAISADGSYYEFKCVGKQNTYKKTTSYGPKRLFDYGTSWVMGPTGLLEGTNGLTCRFLNYYVGTCNTGINYGLCSNSSTSICGSDGTSYNFITEKTIRSSFGSFCRNNGTGTRSVTCNPKASNYSSSSSSSSSSIKIPFNATRYSNTIGWKCNNGYFKSGNKCKPLPSNAYSVGSSCYANCWDCKGGYEKHNNGCRKISDTYTYNAETEKYELNSTKENASDPGNAYSLSDELPQNSHKSGAGWECNSGFSQYGNKCVAKSSSQNESTSYLEEIKQAKELLDDGIITEDEFTAIKKKIIDDI
mgnify:FL=1